MSKYTVKLTLFMTAYDFYNEKSGIPTWQKVNNQALTRVSHLRPVNTSIRHSSSKVCK